tara:strand:+ start:1223 stop:1399 length:177 start_codon:yes stop_codon:yes gene_type:complete
MEYDFKSLAQPILTVEQFKNWQKDHGINLNHVELFFAYRDYVSTAKEYNKAYGDIEDV